MSTLHDKTALVSKTARQAWRQSRLEMERAEVQVTPAGRRNRNQRTFDALIALFGAGLRVAGLYGRGLRNAGEVRLNRIDLRLDGLPPAFDGFRLLQLSDLHADFLPEALRAAVDLAAGVEADVCLLTGDFRKDLTGPFDGILPAMADLAARVATRHGIFAVLGNHDTAEMVEPFEALGIRVLANETHSLRRGAAALHLTGVDDVHYYYTGGARDALALAPEGFRIAVVHSAELADAAAEEGYHLYLAGHTHGGQVCLPGGWPILTQMTRFRRYARGLWRHGEMRGYTTSGVGVSSLPVRFNSRGEVALITLRAGGGGQGA